VETASSSQNLDCWPGDLDNINKRKIRTKQHDNKNNNMVVQGLCSHGTMSGASQQLDSIALGQEMRKSSRDQCTGNESGFLILTAYCTNHRAG
jgi:hypothetical protein